MKILSIGNSFSQDAQRYLHALAKADGENFKTVNLYIGVRASGRDYSLRRGNVLRRRFRDWKNTQRHLPRVVGGRQVFVGALLVQSFDGQGRLPKRV